jgi:hypothetical protein
MRRSFQHLAMVVEIDAPAGGVDPGGRRLRFDGEWEAERFLSRLALTGDNMAGLRRILLDMAQVHGIALADDHEIVCRLARLIVVGRLWVVEQPRAALWTRGHTGDEDEDEREPPPIPAKHDEVKTWIEIVLVDWDDKAVPYEVFELTLPDQSIMQGTLDGEGFARVDGIDPGTCQLRFPRRDETDWDPRPDAAKTIANVRLGELAEPSAPGPDAAAVAAANLPKNSWIDLELLDEEDNPVPSALYRVEAADGSITEGRLGTNGRAHVEGIVFGSCRVTFPDFDGNDMEKQ